jgi:hypothetical protein
MILEMVKQLECVGCENVFYLCVVQMLSLLIGQIDALTTKRGKEGGWVVERLLNQV